MYVCMYACVYVCMNQYADVSLTEWLRYSASRMHAPMQRLVEFRLDVYLVKARLHLEKCSPSAAAQNLPLLPGAYDLWTSKSSPTRGTYGPQMCAALLVDH